MIEGWPGRLAEIGSFRSTIPWDELWPLLALAQAEKGIPWLERILWRFRLHQWILALDDDERTCRTCGAMVSPPDPLRRYCSTACRKVAFRRRQGRERTAIEQVVLEAHRDLSRLQIEVDHAQAWMALQRRRKRILLPPDLLRIDHLPELPARCGAACSESGKTCVATGSVCLYAATGGSR
jgi:hypothetical protein